MAEGVVVVGAGGHGRVVADAVRLLGHPIRGFLDDSDPGSRNPHPDVEVIGSLEILSDLPDELVHGIGDNATRQAVATRRPDIWMVVVHPEAVVAQSARLDTGAVVLAGAIVQVDVTVGSGAIVNSGAIVEHDCRVGRFSHIAPHATLTGAVTIGERTLVGAGATIAPGCVVGDDVVIGAGAVVIRDVPSGFVVAGNPAQQIGRR